MEVENGTCRFIGTSKFPVQVSVALRLELFSEANLEEKGEITQSSEFSSTRLFLPKLLFESQLYVLLNSQFHVDQLGR